MGFLFVFFVILSSFIRFEKVTILQEMLQKIFIFIILISTSFIYAQKLDAVRIEVASDIDIEHFHVEPIGTDGLLIFYESGEVSKEKKRKWYFGLFDTKLKQQWLNFVPLYDQVQNKTPQTKSFVCEPFARRSLFWFVRTCCYIPPVWS